MIATDATVRKLADAMGPAQLAALSRSGRTLADLVAEKVAAGEMTTRPGRPPRAAVSWSTSVDPGVAARIEEFRVERGLSRGEALRLILDRAGV